MELKLDKQKKNAAGDAAAGAGAPAKTRKLVTVFAVIASVVAALGVFLMVWYLGDRYPDFERRFRQETEIPALDEGFIPQGLGNSADGDVMFISGYMNDGSPSRIYVLEDGAVTGYVTVTLDDGSAYTGHAGGVASNGTSRVWIASGGKIYVLSYSEVMSAAEDNGAVEITNSWNANCNASFCYYRSGYLYVGEFYRAGNYETDMSHRFTTPAGDENTAIILRYSATTSTPAAPSRIFSITGKIQGMAMSEDGSKIILSQSYGLHNSHILTYSFSTSSTAHSDDAITINGTEYDVYFLDSANLLSDYEIPSMSEGMCSDGDRIYVLFESASVKYGAFVREKLEHIYSFRLRNAD